MNMSFCENLPNLIIHFLWLGLAVSVTVENKSVQAGKDVTLRCDLPDANTEIIWLHNDQAVMVGGTKYEMVSRYANEKNLKINSAKEDDAGTYACKNLGNSEILSSFVVSVDQETVSAVTEPTREFTSEKSESTDTTLDFSRITLNSSVKVAILSSTVSYSTSSHVIFIPRPLILLMILLKKYLF